MNVVCLTGRLTKDPELRYTPNQVPVCNFTLAVDRGYKKEGQPDADFPQIIAWNKAAEFASKYFSKGLRVSVVGRIQTRSWEDDSGGKHYVTEVVSRELGFADGKKDNNMQQSQPEVNNLPIEEDEDLPF